MNKEAYDQGFIDVCNAYNIDPHTLIKQAGLYDYMTKRSPIARAGTWLGNKSVSQPNTHANLGQKSINAYNRRIGMVPKKPVPNKPAPAKPQPKLSVNEYNRRLGVIPKPSAPKQPVNVASGKLVSL